MIILKIFLEITVCPSATQRSYRYDFRANSGDIYNPSEKRKKPRHYRDYDIFHY